MAHRSASGCGTISASAYTIGHSVAASSGHVCSVKVTVSVSTTVTRVGAGTNRSNERTVSSTVARFGSAPLVPSSNLSLASTDTDLEPPSPNTLVDSSLASLVTKTSTSPLGGVSANFDRICLSISPRFSTSATHGVHVWFLTCAPMRGSLTGWLTSMLTVYDAPSSRASHTSVTSYAHSFQSSRSSSLSRSSRFGRWRTWP